DGTRLQPLHALIPVRLAGSLSDFLKSGGSAVREWHQSLRLAVADYSDRPGAFANVNTWEELRRMEQHLAARC
ncbi:MAG: molybdenum cofactor guanylyltransferase MobA, partial [Chromatiaceae bacterium]